MKPTQLSAFISAISASALLTACGGSSDPQPATITGVFLDAAVESIDYTAGSAAKAVTNARGEFNCLPGDTVKFGVANIDLGSAPCAALITPLTLAGGTDARADKVVNRLLTLQTLDEDGDPSNGIKLTADLKTALGTKTLDFSKADAAFRTDFNAVVAALPAAYQTRTADDNRRMLAREHFEDTMASKTGTPLPETISQTNGAGAVSASITRYQVQAADAFYIPYEGTDARIKASFPKGFLPAYGSGLAFKGKLADGTLEFYAITDRGPNGDGPLVPNTDGSLCAARASGDCDTKIFSSPNFTPSIGVISVGAGGAVLKSSLPIKSDANTKINGRSPAATKLGSSGEVPLNDALKFDPAFATFSDQGLDTESIVVDTARNALWVSDEYGPFIVRIDPATGVIQKKYGPAIPAGSTLTGVAGVTSVLPAVLSKRRANRGMEGLSLDLASGKLHGFLQSPLSDLAPGTGAPAATTYVQPAGTSCADTGTNKRVDRFARFTRWIEFDPSTETSKMYAFPINCMDYDQNRTGNAKLGDMVSLGNGKFIVIEQGAAPDGKVFNRLMLVEVGAATDIAQAQFNPATSDLEKSSMSVALVNGADYSKVVPLKKTLLLDLNAAGWIAEKAEGLALVDASTLALVNDDDFGLRTQVFNSALAAIPGADITSCTSTNGVLSNCVTNGSAGVSARVSQGLDAERPNRIWLLKFNKNLADFSVPAL